MSTNNASPAASNIRSALPVRLPVGVSNFATLVRGGYTFVDKTQLIEDVLQIGAEVTLITRPRRFGKTLNQSMLQHFFAAEVDERPTGDLFDGLAVASRPAAMAHQGQYCVIFLRLKEIKGSSFEKCEAGLRTLLANLYQQYPELLKSEQLNPQRRKQVNALLERKADLAEMADSVRLLSELLYKHHKRKVVILLDEYDSPIHAAYTHGFYSPLVEFMRNLLGAAFKDNPYLFKAVVTGILRVSKESMFSGLNNIKVHTVLDDGYSSYFGFTEAEVSGLLNAASFAAQQPALESQIKHWYNGYRFGSEIIYNPWSIISCLDAKGQLAPWWINTSGDDVLKKLMAQADAHFKEGLERLIQGGTVDETIDPSLVFADLDGNSMALWSLLLFSGYLTAPAVKPAGTRMQCELAIPNQEIRYFYEDIVREWFTGAVKLAGYRNFLDSLQSLLSGDLAQFEAVLRDYLLHCASYFDAQGKKPEKFYHGLVLGMIVALRDTHDIRSNRESGHGRYDVALFPKAGAGYDTGIVMEFKQLRDPAGLKTAAETALAQIDARRYTAELKQHPVKTILSIGLAFAGKEMALAGKAELAV